MSKLGQLKDINRKVHEHLQWTSDLKTFNQLEKWKSWWPEIKLIREGRASEVAAKLKSQQFHWSYNNLILHGDCDDWAMTSAEACLEKQIADPQFIGIAIVLTRAGARRNVPYDHAIMVVSLDEGETWLTIDNQSPDVVDDEYMGHKFVKVTFMDSPGEWFGPEKVGKS